MPNRLAGQLLELRPRQLSKVTDGFAKGEPEAQAVLDTVVASFAAGYNHIVSPAAGQDPSALPYARRGFAIEGAAMSATLADLLTFSGGSRLRALHAENPQYTHLIHVGAGWAFARLHRRPWSGVRFGEPLIRWLVWDGWGFHQAFFHQSKVFGQQWIESGARGETRPIRDQGAGRALWFCQGADIERVAAVIGRFPAQRRGDLWAGIGLAACYTGAQTADAAQRLVQAAADYRHDLGQGAAFAAKAHSLAGEVPPASAATIGVLTGADASVAAAWTDRALAGIRARGGDDVPAYQQWRALIRDAVRQGPAGPSTSGPSTSESSTAGHGTAERIAR